MTDVYNSIEDIYEQDIRHSIFEDTISIQACVCRVNVLNYIEDIHMYCCSSIKIVM